jgi:hypothetical protein
MEITKEGSRETLASIKQTDLQDYHNPEPFVLFLFASAEGIKRMCARKLMVFSDSWG